MHDSVANPYQDMEGLPADVGDASVLVHDGGLLRRDNTTPRGRTRGPSDGGTPRSRETKMYTESAKVSQFGALTANPSLTTLWQLSSTMLSLGSNAAMASRRPTYFLDRESQ